MITRRQTRQLRHTCIAAAAVAAVVTGVLTASATEPQRAAAAGTSTTPAHCTIKPGHHAVIRGHHHKHKGRLDVLDSLAQVLPARHLPGGDRARICSPRDAYASFQIEITANRGTALHHVVLRASDLAGPHRSVILGTRHGASSDIQLDRERYTTLHRVSDGELDPNPAHVDADGVTPRASRVARNESTGACTDTADSCRFPDALLPDRDSLYGERRNAFRNLTVPAGENRTVWVDVFVPATARAGTYTGRITTSVRHGKPSTVPVHLHVVAATLPATSSAHSTFFFNTPGNTVATYREYAELGLDDRISVVPQGVLRGSSPSAVQAALGPLFAGADRRVQLQDADGRHASLTDFPINATNDAGYVSTYRSLFTSQTTTHPWAYCDEVGYQYCADAYATSVERQWPGLPLLAVDAAAPNSAFDPTHRWSDPADSVVPEALRTIVRGVVQVVQYLDPTYDGWKPAQYSGLQDRSRYFRDWRAADPSEREAWVYTSNMSGTGGGPYSSNRIYSGFPSYGIDQIASEQEAVGWQLFTERMQGELYWSVNQNPQISSDPNDSHDEYLGLNGDGTLFYPWNILTGSRVIGGADPIPLESIRLKRIRNGRQDYELLRLADTRRLVGPTGRTAASIAHSVFPAVSASAVTPERLDRAEQALLRLFG